MSAKQLTFDFGRSDQKTAGALAAVLPQVRAAMNRVAAEHPKLSRDLIADRMTIISKMAGIKLVSGNAKSVKTPTIEKWLSPTATEHPPSLMAVMTFCMVLESMEPLEPLFQAMDCEVMTKEDRNLRDYAKAILAEKEARLTKKKLEASL